jgi:hypothetical protein
MPSAASGTESARNSAGERIKTARDEYQCREPQQTFRLALVFHFTL